MDPSDPFAASASASSDLDWNPPLDPPVVQYSNAERYTEISIRLNMSQLATKHSLDLVAAHHLAVADWLANPKPPETASIVHAER